MKRWLVGALLLLLGCVVLAGCGGSDSQSSNSSSSGSSSNSSGSQNASSQGSSSGTQSLGSGAQTVNILEGDMYIKSDVTSFKVGTPYHFVVKNEGKVLHEFTIAKEVPGGNHSLPDPFLGVQGAKPPSRGLGCPRTPPRGPLKYRFFAGPASQAEEENTIYICSNGFSGGFIGNLSKKPILERPRGRRVRGTMKAAHPGDDEARPPLGTPLYKASQKVSGREGGNQDSRDAASVKDVDNIEPGQTIIFDFTFKDPAPPVGMEFECSYPGHYEMGMHMDITVK